MDDELRRVDRVVDLGIGLRRAMLREPLAMATFARRPVVSPQTARATEVILAACLDAGVPFDDLAAAADAFVVHTLGSATYEHSRPPRIRDGLVDQLPADELPLTNQLIEAYADRDTEARYAKVMRWLIAGLVAGSDGGRDRKALEPGSVAPGR